ncbi:MBL fold metallo-hydrolase, partial [Salmonella enterica]|uniref:MBL fold metallo-hydrolase n=1 Tax=Salmonella enterica TaxID=28901 RepID=UPI00329A7E20
SRGYIKDGRSFNAYIVDYGGSKILFGGDTAMTDKFNAAKNENIDIAIMPIGAYNPWRRNHCNPEEALLMANDIGAKYFIPIHTKTFKQG